MSLPVATPDVENAVLGLIFLRYVDHRFTQAQKELEGKGSGRQAIGKEDYQAKN